jgi:hypothetical protein
MLSRQRRRAARGSAHAAPGSLPRCWRRSRLTVLTRANRRDRERALTRLNAQAAEAKKVLQTRRKDVAAAKARQAACGSTCRRGMLRVIDSASTWGQFPHLGTDRLPLRVFASHETLARRELDRGRGGPSGVPGGDLHCLKDAQFGPFRVARGAAAGSLGWGNPVSPEPTASLCGGQASRGVTSAGETRPSRSAS